MLNLAIARSYYYLTKLLDYRAHFTRLIPSQSNFNKRVTLWGK